MSERLGVGFVGAGPVTQAIHLPAVAAFPDRLSVVHVMDVDENLARGVAARCPGAAHSASLDDLLADDLVDIVVVGSPDRFHADQVVAICERGARAVLCEKPLAVSQEEGRRILEAIRAADVPLVVGTMHAFDPAWQAAEHHWRELDASAEFVRGVVQLPGNDFFINAATRLLSGSQSPASPDELTSAERRVRILRGSILGLLIHNIPLIRQLVPELDGVASADAFEPFGSRLVLECGEATVELHGLMPGRWGPNWQLRAWSGSHELAVQFPPSYVMAGSARAAVATAVGRRSWRFPYNGYRAEWEHLIEVANRDTESLFPIETALDDLSFALDVCRLAEPMIGVAA